MDLYYALWATMLGWPLLLRAAVVIGILFAMIYLLLPLLFHIVSWLFRLFDLIVKILYYILCLIIQLFYHLGLHKWVVKTTNRLSLGMQKLSKGLLGGASKIRKRRRFRIVPYVICYLLCIGLIGLPDMAKGILYRTYLDKISVFRELYQDMERKTIETAKDYEPLFQVPEKPQKDKKKNKKKDRKSDTNDQQIWLSLTGEGVSGANIRAGKGTEYESIAVVKGDDKLLYLDAGKAWVHVRTEEGVEGWIRKNIVTGLP